MKRIVLFLGILAVAAACVKDPETPEETAESISLSDSQLYIAQGETYKLTYTIMPATFQNVEVLWNSDNPAVATVDSEGLITGVALGAATISAAIKDAPSVNASCAVQVGVQGAVDLGLSVLWAACNIGAKTPEGYGNYYAWGELAPRDAYNWDNYRFVVPGDMTITKYCTLDGFAASGSADNKKVLESADDVATQELGGKWRTPTKAEWDEIWGSQLLKWVWTKHILTSGESIRGCEVYNKETGAMIFLPYAGYMKDNTLREVNEMGNYWTADIDTGYPLCAYGCDLTVDSWYTYQRCQGLPVRAVCDK